MFAKSPLLGHVCRAGLVVAWIATAPAVAFAQTQVPASVAQTTTASGLNTYDELYLRYLDAARHAPAQPVSWMADLMLDQRAHRVNDLVTIHVVESLTASGSADATVNKSSKVDAALPSPLSKALGKIVPASSDTKFAGSGGTTRASTMSATVTGRVTEVLPNGDLVVEGIREIQVNNDRQVVVLTGVVRQTDIAPGNVVSSTSVGQLRIQCIGKGLIKDSLTPGWLVRMFNKIF